MAEIFFIASDERALDLIESLRIQSPKSLTFETDLPSAIGRLRKEQPHYVFIQSSLDGTPAEEIAVQTRGLVADPGLQLVLLSDGEAPPPPAGFAGSFSLALATSRLSDEVMQLLNAEVAAGLPPKAVTDFSDLSDFGKLPDLFLEDQSDFEVPDFDDAAFEPHLAPLWPDQAKKDAARGREAAFVPPAAKEADHAFDEIGFFVTTPEPSSHRVPKQGSEPAAAVPATPVTAEVELTPVIPVAPVTPVPEPSVHAAPAPPVPQDPAQRAPVTPASQEPPPAKPARRAPKSLYPTPEQIYRKPPELCGEDPDEDDLAAVPEPVDAKKNKNLVAGLALLGVAVLALGGVFWQQWKPEPAPSALRSLAAPAPAATAPATQPPAPATGGAAGDLPGFVPKVPADAAYAAAHPGWELYRGDGKEFRIYREQGKVKAIQVLADGGNDLNEGLLAPYFKEATGAELPIDGETRAQNAFAVETRKARDGAEIAIYRTAEPRVVGIVLQLPAKAH